MKGVPFCFYSPNGNWKCMDLYMQEVQHQVVHHRSSYTPWQNEAERYIQVVKKMVNTIMDHTWWENNLWVMCAMYVVYFMNPWTKADLQWRSKIWSVLWNHPRHISTTPLHIHQWKDILPGCRNPIPWVKDKAGWFIGIAESVGDALTFWILTEDTEHIIARSVIRTAEDPKAGNMQCDLLKPPTQNVIGMKDQYSLRQHYPPLILQHSLDTNSWLSMQAVYKR